VTFGASTLAPPAAPPEPPPVVLCTSLEPEIRNTQSAPFAPLSEVSVVPEPPAPAVEDFTPIGPVDIRFDDGADPIGVRPGTRTYEQFQTAAAVLFAELRRAVPR
jgi:hypothetical protein